MTRITIIFYNCPNAAYAIPILAFISASRHTFHLPSPDSLNIWRSLLGSVFRMSALCWRVIDCPHILVRPITFQPISSAAFIQTFTSILSFSFASAIRSVSSAYLTLSMLILPLRIPSMLSNSPVTACDQLWVQWKQFGWQNAALPYSFPYLSPSASVVSLFLPVLFDSSISLWGISGPLHQILFLSLYPSTTHVVQYRKFSRSE